MVCINPTCNILIIKKLQGKLNIASCLFMHGIKEWSCNPRNNMSLSLQWHLSIAIDHLLSMKSVAASSVAGHANAVTRVLNTVIMAPRFINSIVSPTAVISYDHSKVPSTIR